jgi:hypothetical protein
LLTNGQVNLEQRMRTAAKSVFMPAAGYVLI